MIVTDKIRLTNKDLFKVYITSYFKRKWHLVIGLWIAIILLLFKKNDDTFRYFVVCSLIFLQIVFLYLNWSDANSESSKNYLKERYFEIGTDQIAEIVTDGEKSIKEIGRFFKVIKTKAYYLLYYTRYDYFCIPAKSFKNLDDKLWFEKEIISRIEK